MDESATPKLEQLAQVFDELKSHTEASLQLQSKIQWDDIRAQFLSLEKSFKDKFDDLEQKQRTLEAKKSESDALIAEREASVSEKEKASLQRLQELRDEVVSAVAEARQKYKAEIPELIDAKSTKDKKVKSIPNDPNGLIRSSEDNVHANGSEIEVKPRRQLKLLCEQMDADGLLKYLSNNWKKLSNLRNELSIALKLYATEPARLVLDSLGGFYPPDQSNSQGNSDTALQALRRSCIVTMESLALALGANDPGVNHPVNSEIKQRAEAIADDWKARLAGADLDASNGFSLEAQAFLQLLVTFSIDPVLDEDELCKLIVAFSRRSQTPELCRSLGLTPKIPGIVEELVKRGRQVDAVSFIQTFELSERFPPVPLLKTYLEDFKDTNANEDSNAVGLQKDPISQELSALRMVIKCIEDFKLQKDYPIGPLQKRVALLKTKVVDKGQPTEPPAALSPPKKQRASGAHPPRRGGAAAPVDTRQLPRMSYTVERYPPYAAPPPGPSYESTAYASTYGPSYGQQLNVQKPYQYPGETVANSAQYNPASYYGGAYVGAVAQPGSNSYGGYIAGAGAQSAYPSSGYQPPHHQTYN